MIDYLQTSLLNRKKILVVLFTLLLIFSIVGAYYFEFSDKKVQQLSSQAEQILQSYYEVDVATVDFRASAAQFENLLNTSGINNIDSEKIGWLKVMYADSLSEIDAKKGVSILKEVAVNAQYSNQVRYTAVNFLVNDYELAPDYEFAKKYIFTGEPYKDFLQGDDVELAMRRLSEWSDEILPNVIANYRIAKWYASQIYQNTSLSPSDKNQFLIEMHKRLDKADALFIQYRNRMTPQRTGLAYELKARTIYMAGESGYKEITEELFNKSINALIAPPNSIFQLIYLTRARLYQLAFLAREYNDTQTDERIRNVLKIYSDYLETPQEPKNRNVRLVKFLIMARDSADLRYPFPDFNQEDIKNLSKVDERFGKIVEDLNYLEYIK